MYVRIGIVGRRMLVVSTMLIAGSRDLTRNRMLLMLRCLCGRREPNGAFAELRSRRIALIRSSGRRRSPISTHGTIGLDKIMQDVMSRHMRWGLLGRVRCSLWPGCQIMHRIAFRILKTIC